MKMLHKLNGKNIKLRLYVNKDDEIYCEIEPKVNDIKIVSNIIHDFLINRNRIYPKPDYYLISSNDYILKKALLKELKSLHLLYKNKNKLQILTPKKVNNDL